MGRLIAFMSECPKGCRARHPYALLTFAINMFSANEMRLFDETCVEFCSNIEADSGLSESKKENLLGEYELLLSFTEYNDILKMLQHDQKASGLMKTTTQIYNIHSSWTFGCPSVLQMFHRECGRLSEEVGIMHTAMPYYYQITERHGYGAEYVIEAEAYFCRGQIDEAEACAYKAVYQSSRNEQWSITLCAVFLQCRLMMLRGDFDALLALMEKTHNTLAEKSSMCFIIPPRSAKPIFTLCSVRRRRFPVGLHRATSITPEVNIMPKAFSEKEKEYIHYKL